MFRRHPLLTVVTFAYLGFVGWVTLSPELPLGDGTDGFVRTVLDVLNRLPGTHWIDYADVEFAANIAMFFPIGMFFVLLLGRGRWWLAMLLGIGLSLVIEVAQYLFFPSRVADARDVLSNSIGAVLGAIGVLILTAAKARELRRAARARQVDRRRPVLQR
ncbi:MAG: VanZ family protein [Naasia sp.]|jgi:VanZ family protein|uniref:VanZ family protein n=1 Tax=Naasia sp. TaxID=2546198 RepID=UPI0026283440|nr:VanZ family protein [Naasia sp.]MCU1571329.1 VanZ family protein [Naasia sp.]